MPSAVIDADIDFQLIFASCFHSFHYDISLRRLFFFFLRYLYFHMIIRLPPLLRRQTLAPLFSIRITPFRQVAFRHCHFHIAADFQKPSHYAYFRWPPPP